MSSDASPTSEPTMSHKNADKDTETDENEETGDGSIWATPNSTSTYRYEHEPFETFKTKVLALTNSLGSFKNVSVERVRGGSYNRVVLARFTTLGEDFESDLLETSTGTRFIKSICSRLPLWSKLLRRFQVKKNEGIFRIPRDPNIANDEESKDQASTRESETQGLQIDSEILDQAAVLQLLTAKGVCAPKLLAFDARAANAINAPYVFQEYSDGQPLDLVYDNMFLVEKLSFVDAFVETLLSLERVTFSKIGQLHRPRSQSFRYRWNSFTNWNFEPLNMEAQVRGLEILRFGNTRKIKSCTSLGEFLSAQLYTWRDVELAREDGIRNEWQELCDMFEEMKELGFFSGQLEGQPGAPAGILFHWDLEPRNILVKRTFIPANVDESKEKGPNTRWIIDKIIDWDRVLSMPAVLTRKPPVWLWDFSDDIFRSSRSSIASDYDGDVDVFPTSRYDVETERLSPDDQKIREHFETQITAGLAGIYPGYDRKTYEDEAYGRGRWIRRLARYAIHGITDNIDFTRLDHFAAEWSETRSRYKTQSQ